MNSKAYRYFLHCSYDGTPYHGWQIQPNANSVQETLNTALSILLREEVYSIGAGRTDTGVHARHMVVHFEVDQVLKDCERWVYKLNKYLPDSIAIQRIFSVSKEFHARFSATKRCYVYSIDRHKDPFSVNKAWLYRGPLDIEKMNKAASALLQVKDFASFAKAGHQSKTTLCSVTRAEWKREGNQWNFYIEADRFLRNMVRAIVGTTVEIGQGKITLAEWENIILSGARSEAGVSAPACGLYLNKIEYPIEVEGPLG